MDAAELLRARFQFDVTLPSGMRVKYHLPRARDCIIAGEMPGPVIEQMAEIALAAEALAAEVPNGDAKPKSAKPKIAVPEFSEGERHLQAVHMARYQDEMVRSMVDEIEGESVSLTLADVRLFPDEDYEALFKIANRKPDPKASAPSEAST